jgi:arsenite-transporting ATPase
LRIILYTGKGGVGKTTVAAATALRTAQQGKKTLVISTDAAHSLADSFDLELGAEPTKIEKNLWGQEIDAMAEMEQSWEIIQGYIEDVFAWGGIEEIMVEELMAFPGLDELFSLLQIKKHYDRKTYEVIVVDCAPTGETLRMLTFPELTRWWLERLFPLQRKATAVARPIMKALTGLPLPDRKIYDSVEDFFLRLEQVHKIFSDPDLTSVRLVLNPEKMVVKEAQRTYTYLSLFGYPVDAVIANRIFPDSIKDHFFDEWKQIQVKYHAQVEEAFHPLPILDAPLFNQEIVGRKMLAEMGKHLFDKVDPSSLMFKGKTIEIEKKGRDYIMSIPLPLVEKGDVDLLQKDDELIIKVGSFKRDIMLPRMLSGMRTKGAKFEEDCLLLTFSPVPKKKEATTNGRKRKK